MADMEKVIKALELCISKHQCCMKSPDEHCPYEDWLGEYEDSFYECTSLLAMDALELINELQEKIKLMKFAYGDQGEIVGELVRCKDCKYRRDITIMGNIVCVDNSMHSPDWFCADGERK